MSYDERTLKELTEESQDLQSDSLSTTREALGEYVESALGHPAGTLAESPASHEESAKHETSLRRGLAGALVAGGFGAGILTLLDAAPAAASSSNDVMILQTAASIEVLAVATYAKALTLPFIGGSAANPVVKAFATTTMGQHNQHRQAFNAAISALGGKAQSKPDPKYAPVVASAVPTLKTAADVVKLATTLEEVAAQTYVKDCGLLANTNARKLMASIMGVEAQHVAVLQAVGALLGAGAPQLISLAPGNAAKLPAVAGSVGIPYTFYPESMASPASEGAVK